MAGSTVAVVALAVGNALLGMSLGLFVSAFARTEFQAVQFMPAFVFPQLLLCGLFVARDQMAPLLEVGLLHHAPDLRLRGAAEGHVEGSLGTRGVLDVAVIVGATLSAPGARRRDAAAPHPVTARSVLERAGELDEPVERCGVG